MGFFNRGKQTKKTHEACEQTVLQALGLIYQQCQALQCSSIKTRYLLLGSE